MEKKSWQDYSKGERITIVVLGAIIASIFIFMMVNSYSTSTSTPQTQTVTQQEQSPVVAEQVESELKAGYKISEFSELLEQDSNYKVGHITSISDTGDGVIEVKVDNGIAEEDADQLSHNILTMTGEQVTELDKVIVVMPDGMTFETSRSDIPMLN